MTDVAATTGSAASAVGRATGSGIGRLRHRLANLTLPQLWAFLAVALPALAALVASLPTVDLAWQIRAGNEILATTSIPSVDRWTFTASGAAWVDQQWGAQILLALVHNLFGWAGLAVFRAVVVGAILAAVAIAITRRNPALGLRTVAWLTIGAFLVASPALAVRPQLLGIAAFAASLLILSDRDDHPRPVWLLVPIAAVWANLHGSFILAPLLPLLAWLEDRAQRRPRSSRLLLVAGAVALATLLNPWMFGAWSYAFGLAGNAGITARISEWQPTTLASVEGLVFWLSVGAVVVFLARRGARAPWWALITLGVFAFLGAWSLRGVAWWPLVAGVTVGALVIPGAAEARRARPSRLNGLFVGLVVALGLVLLPFWRAWDERLPAPAGLLRFAPPELTASLRGLVVEGDRVWNPQVWGSWFEYAIPDATYAVDSRIEVIPAAVWREAEIVSTAGAGWEEILDRAGTTIIVTEGPTTGSPLFAALQGNPGWAIATRNTEGSIWVRRDRPSGSQGNPR